MDKTHVRLDDGYRTTVTARSHVWHGDVPEKDGGQDSDPTPEEMLMGALGSCMAMTAKMYAARKDWPLEAIEISLGFERITASKYPGYVGDAQFVHEVHEQVTLYGPLSDEQKARIMDIITKCPVRRIITNPVFIVEELVTEPVTVTE
jgi:putative redox protein